MHQGEYDSIEKNDVIMVHWGDACESEDNEDLHLMETISTGIVWRKTPEQLILAGCRFNVDQGRRFICIPRVMIQTFHPLYYGEQDDEQESG